MRRAARQAFPVQRHRRRFDCGGVRPVEETRRPVVIRAFAALPALEANERAGAVSQDRRADR